MLKKIHFRKALKWFFILFNVLFLTLINSPEIMAQSKNPGSANAQYKKARREAKQAQKPLKAQRNLNRQKPIEAKKQRPEGKRLRENNADERPLKKRANQAFGGAVADWQTSLSLVLGRPANNSITLSVLSKEAIDGYVEYKVSDKSDKSDPSGQSGLFSSKTKEQSIPANIPTEILLDSLQVDKQYLYRFVYRKISENNFSKSPEYSFHTQRLPDSSFTFEIQGDSHPERQQQFDPALYTQTLKAAAKDNPDFYIMMGDDFSVDTLHEVNGGAVEKIYLNQRYFLSLLGRSVPLFLVNGNHEQAAMYNLNGTTENVAVWAQNSRNKYFPQPAPDNFYAGNTKSIEHIGQLRDYYAWTWGDALFVVIDPYWHSSKPVDNVFGGGEKTRDMWAITLGDEQYKWFKETLEKSKSKYKFVFTHHILGTGRGGIERAGLFEWGGKNNNGDWEFDAKRPGWELPIHQLMVKNKVTIFFQGHDHVFAREELDGVVYQTMPEPADPNYALYNSEYYPAGDVLPNSGRVRVNVSSDKIIVDYIKSYLQNDASPEHPDSEIAYSYEIKSDHKSKPEVKIFKRDKEPSEIKSEMPKQSVNNKLSEEKKSIVPFNIILGRPTNKSITVSLYANISIQGYIEYGTVSGEYKCKTTEQSFPAFAPAEIILDSLQSDKQYFYRFAYHKKNEKSFSKSPEYTFHTQRSSGSEFKFAVQSDPHNQDPNVNFELYKVTAQNIKNENPDFLIDLGDNFMTEKISKTKEEAKQAYIDMRLYYGITASSIPLFLLIGNHDGELGWKKTDDGNCLPVWANLFRKTYYPCQTADSFYSGSKISESYIGRHDGYYAWEWGDALLVVIDPYWNTAKNPNRGGNYNWNWTLGKEQYDWFAKTLQESSAKFKFVFSHQLVGGFESGRGGVEAAKFYEWGGLDNDGIYKFDEKRPGWGKPIHQLMKENKVTIFFHGHDHFFAKQELDGIIYQLVPQPDQMNDRINQKEEYGYKEGIFQPNSGHLLIDVSSAKITVLYIRSILPEDEKISFKNGQIEYEYSCYPK